MPKPWGASISPVRCKALLGGELDLAPARRHAVDYEMA
jgi:hypothetical protein